VTLHAVTAVLAGGGSYSPFASLGKNTSAGVGADNLTPGVVTRQGGPRATSAQVAADDLSGGVVQLAPIPRSISTQELGDLTAGVQDRDSLQHPTGSIGVSQSAITVTTYFKKRARDSACGPATYVTWVTTNASFAFPGALPCGGPLVEEIIAETWQV
jgi:hypothetical protein